MIAAFEGQYRWLSNFWPAPVVYDGIRYPSVEHAYVAAKTDQPELRVPLQRMLAGQAKRYGRTLPLREGWDDMRLTVMCDLLDQKFEPGYLRDNLLATGDEEL